MTMGKDAASRYFSEPRVMDLTLLRLVGLAGGLLFLLLSSRALRKADTNPVVVGGMLLTGAGLAGVSLLPGIAGALADLMALGRFEGSRLIALLVAAVAVLWVSLVGLLGRTLTMKEQLDKLIRHCATSDLKAAPVEVPLDSVACVLPALNEADNIGHVLARMPAAIDDRKVVCIVVDDGSTDGTGDVARGHGALVVRNPFKRGGGAALRAGFDAAAALNAQVVVTIDADGQNDPREMPGLVRPILEDRADVVIGSRILGHHEKTNWWRHLGVLLFSRVMNALMGTRITDISSGYRAIRVDSLDRLRLRQDQYHTSEFLMLAAKAKLRIDESPITFTRRLSGKSKKGNEILYGLRFARVLLGTWLRVS